MAKKIFSIMVILLSLLTCTAKAYDIGQDIGDVLNTDIVVYINNYAIPSFAANGTSVIVAEDLRNFGFDVVWDGGARTLNITRNGNTQVNETEFKKSGAPGSKAADMLFTDIKVFADGVQLPSYAINGYTMIPMESLTMYGEVNWVSEQRALKMWVDGLHIRSEMQKIERMQYNDKYDFDYLINNPVSYDLNIDGVNDTIATSRKYIYLDSIGNCVRIELIINGRTYYVADRRHGWHDKVFIADIDPADSYLDIVMVERYKGIYAGIYRFDGNNLIGLTSQKYEDDNYFDIWDGFFDAVKNNTDTYPDVDLKVGLTYNGRTAFEFYCGGETHKYIKDSDFCYIPLF